MLLFDSPDGGLIFFVFFSPSRRSGDSREFSSRRTAAGGYCGIGCVEGFEGAYCSLGVIRILRVCVCGGLVILVSRNEDDEMNLF